MHIFKDSPRVPSLPYVCSLYRQRSVSSAGEGFLLCPPGTHTCSRVQWNANPTRRRGARVCCRKPALETMAESWKESGWGINPGLVGHESQAGVLGEGGYLPPLGERIGGGYSGVP